MVLLLLILDFYQKTRTLCLYAEDPETRISYPFECVSFWVNTCDDFDMVMSLFGILLELDDLLSFLVTSGKWIC